MTTTAETAKAVMLGCSSLYCRTSKTDGKKTVKTTKVIMATPLSKLNPPFPTS